MKTSSSAVSMWVSLITLGGLMVISTVFMMMTMNFNFNNLNVGDVIRNLFFNSNGNSLQSYRLKLLEKDWKIHQELKKQRIGNYETMKISSSLSSVEEKPFFITEPILKVLSEGKLEEKCQQMSTKNYKWMADNYDILKKKSLNRIKIPGTHDSFTNSINFRNNASALMFANDSPNEMWKIFSIPFIPKTFMLAALVPWANTQSCTVTEQLNHGIRYFDVRICKDDRESLDNQFKFCHNFYAGKIIEIMNQVRDFVINVAPSEFIILDFNHFYGMNQKDHDYLLSKIIDQVGDVMVKSSQFHLNSTLESMWASTTRRLFVFYGDDYLKKTSSEIVEYFHTNEDIEYTWADTLDRNYLNEYNLLKLAERSKSTQDISNTLLNLQLILTPDIGAVILGFLKRPYSILDITEPMANAIQQWLPSYNQSLLNIITCDYYHLFNFTDIVIQSNT